MSIPNKKPLTWEEKLQKTPAIILRMELSKMQLGKTNNLMFPIRAMLAELDRRKAAGIKT